METTNTTNLEDQSEIRRITDEIRLAKCIVSNCKKKYSKITKDKGEYATMFYTGIPHTEALEPLFAKKSETYKEWLQKKEMQKNHRPVVSYEHLRKAIYTEYVDKLKLPTIKTVMEALLEHYKNDNNIKDTLKMDIKTHGFYWKRLSGTKKFILIENAQQVSRRMRYLYEINQIREANRVIVHVEIHKMNVDVNIHDPEMKETHQIEIAVAVSPQIGLVGGLVNTGDECSTNIETLLNTKLNGLPEDTVFVIEPSLTLQEDEVDIPTEHSEKDEMVKWLQKHNVPHITECHRGELFALIEMYKSRFTTKADCFKLLKAKKYKILFRPPELSYMKYFTFLWQKLDDVKNNTDLVTLKSEYLNIIDEVSNEDWNIYDCDIAHLEQFMLKEEEKLELVLDKLMEAMQNYSLNESDFEECEEDVTDDEYIDSILTE